MIIVTGGAGFIGSQLIKQLEARTAPEIAVCDILGTDDKWKNIAKREIACIVAPDDLTTFLNDNAANIETVFHMGAVSSTTERDADLIVRSNFTLSMTLWEWCARNNVTMIYASSAATYGDGTQGFKGDDTVEGLARLRPMNAYGWSKHVFDRRITRIVSENGPRPPHWAGLKFFNVYGPNEYHKGNMISVALKNFNEINETGQATLFRSHNPKFNNGGQRETLSGLKTAPISPSGYRKTPPLKEYLMSEPARLAHSRISYDQFSRPWADKRIFGSSIHQKIFVIDTNISLKPTCQR